MRDTRGVFSSGGNPLLQLGLLAALSLLPFVFMTCTSFAKISVVLSLLRNALGTGQAPSGMVLSALAAMLTLLVMQPVCAEALEAARPQLVDVDLDAPLTEEGIDHLVAAGIAGFAPFQRFLRAHAGDHPRAVFTELAREAAGDHADSVSELDLRVLLPAFLVTELTEALQIGFLVYLPFLVVDLVVANLLLALGMHMLSPTSVSLPFKLLLFVTVDGFALLSQALVAGYRPG